MRSSNSEGLRLALLRLPKEITRETYQKYHESDPNEHKANDVYQEARRLWNHNQTKSGTRNGICGIQYRLLDTHIRLADEDRDVHRHKTYE
jgi:hypothetical protein